MPEQYMNFLGTTSLIGSILALFAAILSLMISRYFTNKYELNKEESAKKPAKLIIEEPAPSPEPAEESEPSPEPEPAFLEELYESSDEAMEADFQINDNRLLEYRLREIEKKLERLEENIITKESIKWISATTFFSILAAIGGSIAIIINAPKLFK